MTMPEHTPPLPTDGATDQEVDTAGTEADEARATREGRRDQDAAVTGRPTAEEPDARSPVDPGSMHRAEDDAAARAGSRDFSEQPDRATRQPPSHHDGD
jgi:hypothetical protein